MDRIRRVTWKTASGFVSLILACALPLPAAADSSLNVATGACGEATGVRWRSAIGEALFFNLVQNGFRAATEKDTKSHLGGEFFVDWGRSIGNLHGWADGDYFMTNYVLHPMQGSINGFIFVQNDQKYRCAVFGGNRMYWKSRARATLFAFVASEALELGPISEASIGNAQRYYPQWGLVDHVITPTVGLVWMIGEDFLDRYVITRIENHTQNMWARALVRSTLNPGRSMANAMAFRSPWHRDTRSNELTDAVLPGFSTYGPAETPPTRTLPIFELAPNFTFRRLDAGHAGALNCVGGGVAATFNINTWFGVTADVGGCKMLSAGQNITGDSLTYVAGPRFTWRNSSHWTPYFEALLGGDKLSTETFDPALRPAKTSGIPEIDKADFHESFTSQAQTNSFAVKVAAGLDHVVNDAFAVRLIEVDDLHLWARTLNGRHYPNNIGITTGVIVRFGTW